MRIASIDIFRALTMFFMIWVNDFWTLTNVPKWLSHASASEDYLGFSDIIFPLFLFIVGLSIPFAIKNRLDKGDSRNEIAKHIVIRSISLIFIGVFMVNWETAFGDGIPGGKNLWGLMMAVAVSLIWINWKRSPVPKKWYRLLQGLGFTILAYLAVVYKGGPEGNLWMTTQWWGILGLIGWAYIFNALLYLYAKGNIWVIGITWLVLNILAVLNFSGMSIQGNALISLFSPIYNGVIPAFTAAGILATLVYIKVPREKSKLSALILVIAGALNIFYGLMTRPVWGISKIQGTPSWLAICTGIGLILFVLLYYLADIKKNVSWAAIISPAGTATLTCYMLPYFIYPIRNMISFRLPEVLNNAWPGLLVSMLFALIVVTVTGIFQRKGYSLKL